MMSFTNCHTASNLTTADYLLLVALLSQSDLHRRVPSHTPILMVFQRNYKQAVALTKERKTALKSTALQWTSEQEQRWQNCMEACMNGEAIYL